jgi:hypothetical protein
LLGILFLVLYISVRVVHKSDLVIQNMCLNYFYIGHKI